MMNYSYKGATRSVLSYIARALQSGKKLGQISDGLRFIVNSYSGLNRNERYDIYYAGYKVARAAKSSSDWRKTLSRRTSFDEVLTATRRTKASYELRQKRNDTRRAMKEENKIFFLCSKHVNPANDHKDYQGKIYVDRFWRMKVSGTEYRAVAAYIRNHGVVTVQKIMESPVYLTTRPYCKHFFIPLDTSTVLGSSVRKIVNEVGIQREPVYDSSEYYKLRGRVYTWMNKIEPCEEFQRIIKRS